MEWVRAASGECDIVYVAHLGDCVERGQEKTTRPNGSDTLTSEVRSFQTRRDYFSCESSSNCASPAAISVFPNPVEERLYVEVAEESQGIHAVRLSDLQGRPVLSVEQKVGQNVPFECELDMAKMPSGL